jgi:hypothetical protein
MGVIDFLLKTKYGIDTKKLEELAKILLLSIGPSEDIFSPRYFLKFLAKVFHKRIPVVKGGYAGINVEITPRKDLHIWYKSPLNLDFLIGTSQYVPKDIGTEVNLPGAKKKVFKVSKPPALVDSFIFTNRTHLQKLIKFVQNSEWEVYFYEKGLRIHIDRSFSIEEIKQILDLGVEMYRTLDRL